MALNEKILKKVSEHTQGDEPLFTFIIQALVDEANHNMAYEASIEKLLKQAKKEMQS